MQNQLSEINRCVVGARLGPDDILRKGDFYIDPLTGNANPCPAPGAAISFPHVWVRPGNELPIGEEDLPNYIEQCSCSSCFAKDKATGDHFILLY